MAHPSKTKGDRRKRGRRGGPCSCGCGGITAAKGYKYIRGHRPHPSLTEVFARHVDVSGYGCWEWQGYIRPAGYGQVGVPGEYRTIDAHRASWIIHHGPIPEGVFVLHRCDNRPCVRPDHLFLGTHKDNMHDMIAKGRDRKALGIDSSNGRLTTAQVEEIRARHIHGIHPARKTGGSSTELAREFGITKQYVWQLTAGMWRTTR